jgi:hypothetical protein
MEKNLIEKGEYILIYDIEDRFGNQFMADLELYVGEDILKSDDEYEIINGKLFISEKDVKESIFDYMREKYPEVYDYIISIGND